MIWAKKVSNMYELRVSIAIIGQVKIHDNYQGVPKAQADHITAAGCILDSPGLSTLSNGLTNINNWIAV